MAACFLDLAVFATSPFSDFLKLDFLGGRYFSKLNISALRCPLNSGFAGGGMTDLAYRDRIPALRDFGHR
jgi:hypothetical protein